MAATARNDGKTTISVGLISVLRERLAAARTLGRAEGKGPSRANGRFETSGLGTGPAGGIGFIKPVGQRYL